MPQLVKPYLAGTQLHQHEHRRVHAGNLGSCSADLLCISLQEVSSRGAEVDLVERCVKVIAHRRIDFELEKLIAHGVHPVGKGLWLLHLGVCRMAWRWRFESYPHRRTPSAAAGKCYLNTA